MVHVTELESPPGVARPDERDAQGSPMHLLGGAVSALLGGAALAVAGRAGAAPLLVVLAVLQGVLAFAFVLGTGLPGRKGAVLVAAMASAGADVAVSLFPHGRLGALLAVLALAVPVMFVHQLARGAARTRLVTSLSGVALLVLCEVALAAWVQLRHEFAAVALGGDVVAAAVSAVAAGFVVSSLVDLVAPVPRFDPEVRRGLLGVVVAAGAGALVGYLELTGDAEFSAGRGLFLGAALGAVAGLLAIASAFVLVTSPPAVSGAGRLLRPALPGLLPLALLAPAAFLLCLAVRA